MWWGHSFDETYMVGGEDGWWEDSDEDVGNADEDVPPSLPPTPTWSPRPETGAGDWHPYGGPT